MSVRRLSQSFLSTRGRGKGSTFVAGYGFGVDEMDLLERVTVGAGGVASITFSSIPQTYQHLHLRICGRTTGASPVGNFFFIRFNSDTGANYSYHDLLGSGSTSTASGLSSQTTAYGQRLSSATQAASVFGAATIDILDYSATTKNKTMRCVGGWDSNGTGTIYLQSCGWYSTTALSGIALTPESGNFAQYTVASLYGVVG